MLESLQFPLTGKTQAEEPVAEVCAIRACWSAKARYCCDEMVCLMFSVNGPLGTAPKLTELSLKNVSAAASELNAKFMPGSGLPFSLIVRSKLKPGEAEPLDARPSSPSVRPSPGTPSSE